MTKLLLWGAGGHSKVVFDIAKATGLGETVIFLDDDPARAGAEFCGRPVLSVGEAALRFRSVRVNFIVCIGDNLVRSRCFARGLAFGWQPCAAVHPTSCVSDSATIGPGTVIMPQVVVNAAAVIGRNCIINTRAVVEHDCRIGANTHLSPGAVLGGTVTVGESVHIGLNASILPCLEIGDRTVVGAGAVVIDSLPADVTAVGVPARILQAKPILMAATAGRP